MSVRIGVVQSTSSVPFFGMDIVGHCCAIADGRTDGRTDGWLRLKRAIYARGADIAGRSALMSFASIVDRCDNFRHAAAAAPLAEFRLAPDAAHVLGLLCPDVVAALHRANAATPDWDIRTLPSGRTLVTFASALATPAARTRALGLLTASWRDAGLFAHVLAPRLWRDELYPVYADPFAPRPGTEAAFVVERAACALFGLVTYGVHMTMYTPEPDTGMRIWVPTRARTKQTCVARTARGHRTDTDD